MDDQKLLAQYVEANDAEAFQELTRRHSGLVKGVCHRVLGNSHDAEDVAQECFLELARDAKHVHSSVVGWLHRAATTRSLNALRNRGRRKVRERVVSVTAEAASTTTEATSRELRQVIDGAMTELSDELRLPMILHFYDGRSQRDVALELGVNQSTVSRRMRDALRQLRDKLIRAGYAASIPALMGAMQAQADASSELGITTVAVTGTAAKAAGSTTLASAVKGSITATLPIMSYFVLGGWAALTTAVCITAYVARYRPLWIVDVFSSFGIDDCYRQPTFFLSRWDWNRPPAHWRRDVAMSLLWSTVLLALSIVFAMGAEAPPWGIVVLALVSAMALAIHAGRIVRRVKQVSSGTPVDPIPVQEVSAVQIALRSAVSEMSRFDVVLMMTTGLIALVVSGRIVYLSQAAGLWPSIALCVTLGMGMMLWGVKLFLHRKAVAAGGSRTNDDTLQPSSSSPSNATFPIVIASTGIISAISLWIAVNPSSIRALSLSMAAVQTSILTWLVYRLAVHCPTIQFRSVRRLIVAVLVGCLVLNSTVCLANLLK